MKDQTYLDRIRIAGFKSIKQWDLPLRPVNVLIGSNGAGKSNLISAFSFLNSVLSGGLQLYTAQSGVNPLLYQGRKVTDSIKMEVYFGNNSYGFQLIPTDNQQLIFQDEYFGYQGPRFSTKFSVGKGYLEAQWEDGVDASRDKYIIPVLKANNWRVYHFHDTGRNAKVKQENQLVNSAALQFDASNLAPFLYRLKDEYLPSYQRILSTIQLVAPYFSDFVLEPQPGNQDLIVLKWRQKGSEDIFNAAQLSDGTLRFICLCTLLLQPPELQSSSIIIDEPELGLHPFAISLLAEMAKHLDQGKQIILSTQSVELLNEFEAEDVIVVDHGKDGSTFERLKPEELSSWLEDYELGDLWKKNLLGGRPSL